MRYLIILMMALILASCSGEGGKNPISSIVDAVKPEEPRIGGPHGMPMNEVRQQPYFLGCKSRMDAYVELGRSNATPEYIDDFCTCRFEWYMAAAIDEEQTLSYAVTTADSYVFTKECSAGNTPGYERVDVANLFALYRAIPHDEQWKVIDPRGTLRRELNIASNVPMQTQASQQLSQPAQKQAAQERPATTSTALPTPVGKIASIVAKDASQAKNIDFLLSRTSGLEGTFAPVASLSESIRKGEVDKVIAYAEVENFCNAIDIDFIDYMTFECEVGGQSLIVSTDSQDVAAKLDGELHGQTFFVVGIMSIIEGHVHMLVN